MRRFRHVIAFVLAALWLPAVWHCGMETVANAVEEQGCCTHESDETSASKGACMADHCSIFDEGHFKVDGDATPVLPEPSLWLAGVTDAWLGLHLVVVVESVAWWPPTTDSHERSWMFEQRAAPQANAPGLIAG